MFNPVYILCSRSVTDRSGFFLANCGSKSNDRQGGEFGLLVVSWFFNETVSGKFRKILKEQVYSKEQTADKFVEKSVNGKVL